MMQKYITNIQFKLLKCQIKSRINILYYIAALNGILDRVVI